MAAFYSMLEITQHYGLAPPEEQLELGLVKRLRALDKQNAQNPQSCQLCQLQAEVPL